MRDASPKRTRQKLEKLSMGSNDALQQSDSSILRKSALNNSNDGVVSALWKVASGALMQTAHICTFLLPSRRLLSYLIG